MHYHGYLYQPAGHGRPPADYDERYRAPWGEFWAVSPWVPGMIAWWLLKPRSYIRNTSNTADEAIKWAAQIWCPLFGEAGDDHPANALLSMDERLERCRDSLARGVDIVLRGPAGPDYREVWVIVCPNAVAPSPPCPLGRTDGRPEGLCRLTGVPLGR